MTTLRLVRCPLPERAATPTNSLLSLTLRNRGSTLSSIGALKLCSLQVHDGQTPSWMTRRTYRSSSHDGSSSGERSPSREDSSSSSRWRRPEGRSSKSRRRRQHHRAKDSKYSCEGGSAGRRERKGRSSPPIPPFGSPDRGCYKHLLAPGQDVWVIQKVHQQTREETPGVVERILTNSSYHPQGIKVKLKNGKVGRVTRIASET